LDRTAFHKIGHLNPSGAEVQISGEISHLKMVEQKRGKRLVASFVDETGEMELISLRAHKWVGENLKINRPYLAFGRVNKFGNGFPMAHPEMEWLEQSRKAPTVAIQPIYPSTEKLTAMRITNRVLSKKVQQLLMDSKGEFAESLPRKALGELNLM